MNQEPNLYMVNPGSLLSVFEKYNNNSQQNEYDLQSKPPAYLKSIELWDESESSPELLQYSSNEISITVIINMYKHIFENGQLQLKFTDYNTGLTSYIDVSKEFKNKILRQIKYCLPGVCLNIDKCKHDFQSPNGSSESNSEEK